MNPPGRKMTSPLGDCSSFASKGYCPNTNREFGCRYRHTDYSVAHIDCRYYVNSGGTFCKSGIYCNFRHCHSRFEICRSFLDKGVCERYDCIHTHPGAVRRNGVFFVVNGGFQSGYGQHHTGTAYMASQNQWDNAPIESGGQEYFGPGSFPIVQQRASAHYQNGGYRNGGHVNDQSGRHRNSQNGRHSNSQNGGHRNSQNGGHANGQNGGYARGYNNCQGYNQNHAGPRNCMGVSNDFNRDRRPRKIDYNWRTGQVMENAGYHAGSDAKLLIGGIQVVKRYESPPCTASDLETCTVDACAADACAAIDACAFSTRAIKFESTKEADQLIVDKATHETLTEEFEVLQEQIRNQKKEAELRESVIKSMKEKKRKMEKEMWYKIMGKKEEELIRLREKLFQNENEARIEANMKDRGISPTSTISPGSSRLGSPETAPTSPESPPKKRKRSPDDEGDDKLEYVDKLESKEPRLDDKVEAKKPKIVKTEAKKPKVDKKAEAKKPNPKEQPDPSTASSCKKWTSLEASLDDKEGKRARFEEPSHALNIAYKDDEDQVDWGEDDDL